jgi:glycosyltransferase involved in cell wall biosynthesis
MKIAYLTAGAAGMYCGSCMNDNAVARELLRCGHDCVLAPIYTPIRTDDENVSVDRVFLGGVNVYLQQKLSWIRHMPRSWSRWLDQPWLIQSLTRNAGKTSPQLLGALAVSMLEGVHGRQRAEFEGLLEWLQSDVKPDVVLMTNLLIGGAIPELVDRLKTRVFVTLQGDDIFLEALPDKYRRQAIERMRGLVLQTDGFIVHSHAYANSMAAMLHIPSHKLHVVPLAIHAADFVESSLSANTTTSGTANSEDANSGDAAAGHSEAGQALVRPRASPSRSGSHATYLPADSSQHRPSQTIGYLARMAPEKGLHQLVDAFIAICRRHPERGDRLHLAGWMGPQHQVFWSEQQRKLQAAGLEDRWSYAGCVDRPGKLQFLKGIDLFCVPTTYADPKGLFLLEAAVVGLPYVMPDHGAFPEVHERLQQTEMSPHRWLYQHGSMSSLIETLEVALKTSPARTSPHPALVSELDIRTHAGRLMSVLATTARS